MLEARCALLGWYIGTLKRVWGLGMAQDYARNCADYDSNVSVADVDALVASATEAAHRQDSKGRPPLWLQENGTPWPYEPGGPVYSPHPGGRGWWGSTGALAAALAG